MEVKHLISFLLMSSTLLIEDTTCVVIYINDAKKRIKGYFNSYLLILCEAKDVR